MSPAVDMTKRDNKVIDFSYRRNDKNRATQQPKKQQ